jgi:conjugal transfer pilus assembly protein TraW
MQARRLGRLLIILACIFFLPSGQAPAGRDLEEIAAGIAKEFPARVKEFEGLARDLARRERARVEEKASEMAVESPGPRGERTLIFITLGEKPEERREENRRMLKEIHGVSPDATLVLRGLPRGHKTLGELVRYIQKLRFNDKEGPQVTMNPVLFRKYGVTVAPTLVYERNGVEVARARGIVNSRWLKDRMERDKASGDLGKWGETAAIAERDLIEEMQARLAGIDWEAKKKQALAGYWGKQRFLELPKAREEKVIYLDATYKVEDDFILPDGKVVARKGEKIDLFQKVPPTFMLIVFDAGDPGQLEWAVKTGRQYAAKYRVKFITTRIPDREHGWDSLAKLYETLEAPVFLLNEQVRDRFKLTHVPGTVRYVKEKQRFEVKEWALKEKDETAAKQ